MKKIVFLVCMSLLFSMNMSAQGWLEKVGQKAVNTAKQKVVHIPEHTHPLIPAELGLLEQQ